MMLETVQSHKKRSWKGRLIIFKLSFFKLSGIENFFEISDNERNIGEFENFRMNSNYFRLEKDWNSVLKLFIY